MPSSVCIIDREWAESLVGLQLQVPEHWWDGCSGNLLFPGKIASFDSSAEKERFFNLELEEELGAYYPMRYDAVSHYADETHRSYS